MLMCLTKLLMHLLKKLSKDFTLLVNSCVVSNLLFLGRFLRRWQGGQSTFFPVSIQTAAQDRNCIDYSCFQSMTGLDKQCIIPIVPLKEQFVISPFKFLCDC